MGNFISNIYKRELIAYIRVSKNNNLNNQKSALQNWAKINKLRISKFYIDECSAQEIYFQKNLMELINDDTNYNKNILVTYVDRFTRDYINSFSILKQLNEKNINIIFAFNSILGERLPYKDIRLVDNLNVLNNFDNNYFQLDIIDKLFKEASNVYNFNKKNVNSNKLNQVTKNNKKKIIKQKIMKLRNRNIKFKIA